MGGLLALVLVAAACAAPASERSEDPASSDPRGGSASEETASEACADGDCLLRQAGELVGINIGFIAPLDPSAPGHQIALDEGTMMASHRLSWNGTWPERDSPVLDNAAEEYAFGEENDLLIAGYHFAWDQELLDDLPGFPDDGWVQEITDPDELRAVLRQRARDLFDRYPHLDKINVINEPLLTLGQSSDLYQNHFYDVLGPDYIVELFQIVDAEAPEGVDLVLNENYIEYFPLKAQGLVDLVADLVDAGAPIDAVGFQTHLMFTELFDQEPDLELYRATMQQVADLGVDVWISEMDNPVPLDRPDRLQYQAANYKTVVEACMSVSRCTDILIWGVTDQRPLWNHPMTPDFIGYAEADALLFDAQGEPKPAYYAVRDALLQGRP